MARAGLRASVFLIALCSLVLLAPTGMPKAMAGPCKAHGDTRPENLTVSQARGAIRCLINKRRGRNLDRNGRLERSAQYHSDYMLDHTCFAHRCGDERSIEGRLRMFDYITADLSFWTYGENIGYGEGTTGTPRSIVRAWMNSPGHRGYIRNKRFRDIGVGFTHGSPSGPNAHGGLYTVDFGARRR